MGNEIAQLPLRDIHLPDAISWWPLAPGWWFLLLLFVIVCAVVWLFKEMKARRRFKKYGFAALMELKEQYIQSQDTVLFIQELSLLLRKLSINTFPRNSVASLTGRKWLRFLDSVIEEKKPRLTMRFDSEIGEVLIAGPYMRETGLPFVDIDGLENLAKTWIQSLPLKTTGVPGSA